LVVVFWARADELAAGVARDAVVVLVVLATSAVTLLAVAF